MVQIKPFDVEQWMDNHETKCKYNIAETCCDSISLAELAALGGHESSSSDNPITASLVNKRLDYGAIRGSALLRESISGIYSLDSLLLPPDNILITPGAIAANFLVFYSLIHPGDHVVCIHPTYQQLYTVPESLGAEVSLWKLKEDQGWKADVEELKTLVKSNTKLIVLNNPNNPTGAVLDETVLRGVYELAKEKNIVVLCDEVYSPVFHGAVEKTNPPPSFASFGYENTIVTGSMSKAYSLAGIRIGWVVSWNKELIELMASARDYNTISVSQLDDKVAAYALSTKVRSELVKRNIALCERNLAILDGFVTKHGKYLEYVKPVAGTTAFVKVKNGEGKIIGDVSFCERAMEETGVLFVPGGLCFGTEKGEFEGYLRIGYACKTEALEEGLAALGLWIEAGGIDKL